MRFSKDILRIGKWHVGGKAWRVTRDVLARIVRSFDLAKQRGVRIPLVWDHDNSARARIGDVTGLALLGDTLMAEVDVADEDAGRKLATVANEVSVEVVEGWRDGQGHLYDWFLRHLGVVNHPVVAGQGAFKRLSTATIESECYRLSNDSGPTVRRFATAQCGGAGPVKVSNAKGHLIMTEGQVEAAQQRIRKKLGISRPTTRQLATGVPADDAATLDHSEVVDMLNRSLALLIGADFEPLQATVSANEIRTVFRILIAPFEKNSEREAARSQPAAPDAMAGMQSVQQLALDVASAKLERRLTRKWRLGR